MCAETGTSEVLYPVGMKMVEFVDPENTDRHIAFMLFYPATIQKKMPPFQMTFFTDLHLYKDATPLPDNVKCPLVIFSHGYGSNGTYYAWFAEFLAARGYIVAAIYHYRANTYDSTAMYLANKLWQRPVDISLVISFLLKDPFWGPRIDPNRIGVAGHSQGGFTALWIGGAKVNPEKFLNFQRIWINRQVIPEYLRRALPLDAKPALHVHDKRVKAVFAMAPGDIKVFGMDEEGLQQLKIPTYIIVGEKDTQTPPKENAEFAAKYIPNAKLELIPGADHEIFVNACDQEGKNVFPGACVDAPGINRVKIHEAIGQAALKFFDTNMPPTVKMNRSPLNRALASPINLNFDEAQRGKKNQNSGY
jgi:predicted dienelactone hydrolase